MARPKKNSKIDFYKVTTLPVVERSARSKEGKRQRDIQQGIKLNTVALNRLGTTLNSLGQSMKELREVNFEIYKAASRQAQDDFKPVFNMPTSPGGRGNQDPKEQTKVKPPSWLESVFELLKMVAAGVIGGLAFKFLSNEENRKKTKEALEKLFDILGVITNFFGTVAYHAIDGLWQLLCNEDASFLERLGGFFKAFVSIGTAFLAIKWLKNPKSLLKDITKAFKGFKGGLKKVAMKLVRKLGKIGIVGLGITALSMLFGGGGDNDQEMAKGGKVRKALRAGGGFINGPQSGYPVSLDGGNSVSFIGHGLEYVAQKASGGFVIPINTPATQNNPGLMGQRMGEANRMGYNLGGMMKGFDAGGEVDRKGQPTSQRGKRESKRLEKVMRSIGGLIPGFAQGGEMKKMGDGARLVNAPAGRCVTGVLNTAQANGAKIGNPNVYTSRDPNNPRGLMSQAVKDFGWTSVNIGSPKAVKSPYGNVRVKEMNKNQWKGAVKQNKIPSGSLVFTTKHGWDWNRGSSGNDAAIAKQGGRKLWSGHWQAVVDGVGMVYGNATKKVVALVHPKGFKGGYDGSSAPGDGGGATPLALSGKAKQVVGNDNAFLKRVKEVSAKVGVHPSDLLGLMASESGLNPQAQNKSGATGLIQFMPATARELGTSTAALKQMDRVQQMEYVEKFLLKTVPKNATPGHLYTAVYLPAFAKKDANYVLAKKGGFRDSWGHHPASWYDQNSGLDQNNDGQITIAELGERIEKKKREFGITGGGGVGTFTGDSSDIAGDMNNGSMTNGIGAAASLVNPMDALKNLAAKFGVDLGENPFAEKPSTGALGSDEKSAAASPGGGAAGAGKDKETLAATGAAVEKTDAMTGSGHTARAGGSSAESTGSASNLKQAGAGDAPSSSAVPGGATGTAAAISPSTNTGGPSGSSGSIMTAQTSATNKAKREKKMQQDELNKAGLEAVAAAEQANAQVAQQVAQANKSVMAASSPKQQFIPTGNGSPKETLVSKMNSANNLMRRNGK